MLTILVRFIALFIIAIVLAAYITPWIIIGIVPMGIVFYIMKQVSAVAMRALKRLENVSRSPLIGHVNVTSQGLATIVSYDQQKNFYKRYEQKQFYFKIIALVI